jgi:mono/diheme cytochrome c family protein
MIGRINILLALLLVVVFVLTAVIQVDPSQPNYEFWPDMKYTPAWTAYEKNPNFADGRTLRTPVAGTIARGELPHEELGNPYEISEVDDATLTGDEREQRAEAQKRLSESIQRGGETYRIFCICCHGPSGAGDGPVSRRGLASPSLLSDKSRQLKDLQLFEIVTKGYDTETWPNSMPPFAAQLTRERRWDVVNYVKELWTKSALTRSTELDSKSADKPNK